MNETHGFIKILPDSTGKRLPQIVMVELEYDNGTIPFEVGDILTSGTSNILCSVYKIEGTTTSGLLHIKIEEPVPINILFTIGENLVVNAVTNAKASSTGKAFYYPINTISGYNNPLNGWDIQANGAGLVSFSQGAPSFDAFGKMLVAQQTTMAEYLNQYDMNTETMSNFLTGTASITHDPLSSGLVFSIGTGATDKAERVSHQYHPYQLGKSRLVEITCACGDQGKANVKRHWGYADSSDGLLFSLVGTTLNVQLRSSVSGTVVKTYTPQSEWNVDRLDGTNSVFNRSGILLNVSKGNIYWIDFQWLGVGKVRFGIVGPDGNRIVCHTIENANVNNRTYMRTGSLPVYAELENYDGTSASSSEFRLWCMVVKTGGEFSPTRYFYGLPPIEKTVTSATTEIPIVSFRSKQTLNSLNNRTSSFLNFVNVISVGGAAQISIIHDPILTGAVFSGGSEGGIEYDATATAVSGGHVISTFYLENGRPKDLDLSTVFNFMGHAIRRHADISETELFSISGKLLTAGSSAISVATTFSDV